MDYNLNRFVEAQETTYDIALSEIKNGYKQSHWMWFIFPQLRGLGESPMSFLYGLQDLEEGKAYLAHPVLRRRLIACCEALLTHEDKTAQDILGEIDARKLRSCMTLFALVCEENSIFHQVLSRFFCGQQDPLTLTLIKQNSKGE